MTDTASPITEPHLSPMFATGEQPVLSPNTEPHPSPIFDTGPHPEPLQANASKLAESPSLEWDSDEWEAAGRALGAAGEAAQPAAAGEAAQPAAAGEAAQPAAAGGAAQPGEADETPSSRLEYERAPMWDAGSPESAPELAKIARGLEAAADADLEPPLPPATAPRAFSELENVDTDAFRRAVTGHLQPVAVPPAQPIVVPSSYQFVKRWKFALIAVGVWFVAAAAGAGCYYWWYTALDKTLPVFGILLYMVACMVASLLVSMVPDRPQVTALAIALMSAPLASTAAAAVLHGAYYFEWIVRPTIG